MEVMLAKVVMTAREWTAAVVLGALLGLAVESALRLVQGRRGLFLSLLRTLLGLSVLCCLVAYGVLVKPWLRLDASTSLAFFVSFLLVAGYALQRAFRGLLVPDGAMAFVAGTVLWLVLATLGAGTIVTSGLMSASEDRPVILVEVTGETGVELVRWEPPGGSERSEGLVTHHVLFRSPEGQREVVAEAWLYGDEVAVKGRVLRLSPTLNSAGIPNLFELSFAHNGYTTLERHNAMPHEGVALPLIGPLSVHRLLRPLQLRLFTAWQTRVDPGGIWGIRAATVESTFFPMVDADGNPVAHTFRVVLTPGGLTAS